MSDAPRATIESLYAAFGAHDADALERLLAPDVSWEQCPGFPGGASRRGAHDVIEGVLKGNADRWRDFRVEVDELLEAGDAVVALGSYSGRHPESGRAMRAQFAHVYRVADGRVRRFQQIADTWPMVAAQRGL